MTTSNNIVGLTSRIGDGGPTVSVVVPCRNERDQIEIALRSILGQEAPPGGFEVIVADGMSDDGTRAILFKLEKENSRLRIIDNPGLIVSTGLNAAIREARGSVIIRMDAHTGYARDYIRQCVQVLQETEADNVGGPWIASGRGRVDQAIAAAFQSRFACGGARGHYPNYSGPVDTVYLGCWRREIFDRIGFFDEELVRNQDDEFNLRLIRAGGTVWQSPQIRSWYTPRASLPSLFRQYSQYGYWKVRVIQKHHIPASWRHVIPGGFLLSLVLLAAMALWQPIALWSLIALNCIYLLANVVASFLTAARHSWQALPVLPIVFACYHFGYGYGFLRGILDFVVFHQGPNHAYGALNRASVRTDS